MVVSCGLGYREGGSAKAVPPAYMIRPDLHLPSPILPLGPYLVGHRLAKIIWPRTSAFRVNLCVGMQVLLAPRFAEIYSRRTIQSLAGGLRRRWLAQAWPYVARGEGQMVASELFCHAIN